jgi:hypothetical protein
MIVERPSPIWRPLPSGNDLKACKAHYRQVRIRVAANLIVQSSISAWLRLFGNEGIRTGHDHLGRQVPMLLATKRAGDKDRTEWELLHTCRNIQSTALALDNELLSILHQTSHAAGTICEYFSVAGESDSAVFLPAMR